MRNDHLSIAQHAHTITQWRSRKPSKESLQDMIKELYAGDIRAEVRQDYLALLYTHFMPPAAAKPKGLPQWVAKAAAGKNDLRHQLRYLFVDAEQSRLVATDGHRLHTMTIPADEQWQGGYYCPKSLEFLHDPSHAQYPDYTRLFPNAETEQHPLDVDAWQVGETTGSKRVFYYLLPDGTALNKKYVDQALAVPGETFTRWAITGAGAVCFSKPSSDTMALVSPIRV